MRPDIINNNTSIEVKNYKLKNVSNMIGNLTNQVNTRAKELPLGMNQRVVIDFIGQDVSTEQKNKIVNKIINKTNGILKPDNITFKQGIYLDKKYR